MFLFAPLNHHSPSRSTAVRRAERKVCRSTIHKNITGQRMRISWRYVVCIYIYIYIFVVCVLSMINIYIYAIFIYYIIRCIYIYVHLHHPNIGFETRLFDEVWICSNKPGIITLVKTYDQWDIFPVAGDLQVTVVVSILSHGPMTWMISGYHHGFGKLHKGIQWDFMRNHWDIPGIIGYNLDIGIKNLH